MSMQPVGGPVGAQHGALVRVFVLGGILQPLALSATEIATAVNLTAVSTARDVHQPLPPAAEPGRRVSKRDELVDADRRLAS